jgi:LemA protein
MSTAQITVLAVAAVLVFWAVGAYNRLMELRNHILRGFAPLDQQLGLRHTLLQRQIDALEPRLPEHLEALSALRAACAQAQAAANHARTHPGASGALNSLRLAEDILLKTRARLPLLAAEHADPAHLADGADLADLGKQIAAAEAALQFARNGFNDAVMEYNRAVQQFPTRLLAGLFGFRPAGAL